MQSIYLHASPLSQIASASLCGGGSKQTSERIDRKKEKRFEHILILQINFRNNLHLIALYRIK